jgi:hypothetical protein
MYKVTGRLQFEIEHLLALGISDPYSTHSMAIFGVLLPKHNALKTPLA